MTGLCTMSSRYGAWKNQRDWVCCRVSFVMPFFVSGVKFIYFLIYTSAVMPRIVQFWMICNAFLHWTGSLFHLHLYLRWQYIRYLSVIFRFTSTYLIEVFPVPTYMYSTQKRRFSPKRGMACSPCEECNPRFIDSRGGCHAHLPLTQLIHL